MSLFDIILLIILGAFGLSGLWFGFIRVLASLVGVVAGFFLASRYYEPFAKMLIEKTGWSENFSKIVVFIAAFFIINRLLSLAFWILDKIFGFITHLPFINSTNRLLGLAFGLFEGALVLGIIFYFIDKFPVGGKFMGWTTESKVVPYLTQVVKIIWPLIPDAIKSIKGAVLGLK
jgi:membrane protein required for colicin V production